MPNGRTLTKTRTTTSTRTATAVALGTVGFAAIAAAALAFNFNELNSATSYNLGGGTTVNAPTTGGGTPSGAVAADTGTAVNIPRPTPTVGIPPTVASFTASSCRSNPKNFPDLTLGYGNVTRAGFGTTRGVVLIQMLNNSDKTAENFVLKCNEQVSGGRWRELGSYPIRLLEGRRQATQSVEYSPSTRKVQCFVDALDQVAETNECNNIKDFNVEAPI